VARHEFGPLKGYSVRAPRDERYQLTVTTLTEAIPFNRGMTILVRDKIENLFWLVAERFVPRCTGIIKKYYGIMERNCVSLGSALTRVLLTRDSDSRGDERAGEDNSKS